MARLAGRAVELKRAARSAGDFDGVKEPCRRTGRAKPSGSSACFGRGAAAASLKIFKLAPCGAPFGGLSPFPGPFVRGFGIFVRDALAGLSLLVALSLPGRPE